VSAALKTLECICYGSNHPNCPYCKKRAELLSGIALEITQESQAEPDTKNVAPRESDGPTANELKDDPAAFIKWLRQQDERDDLIGNLARGKFPKLAQDGAQDGPLQYTRVRLPAWAKTIDQLRYQLVSNGATAEAVEAFDTALEEWRGGASEDVVPCEYGHASKRNRFGECIACNRQRTREWKAANPEAAAEQRRKKELQKKNTDEVLNQPIATGTELAELQRKQLMAEIASGKTPENVLLQLQVREYVERVAQQCAFKLHLNRLRGRDIPRLAVINDVVARLCAPEGPFCSVPPTGSKEQFELVYRELDSARKRYAKEMGRVSTPDGSIDDEDLADLDRHTEEGQALVNEPTVALARAQVETSELARIEARPAIEAAENADADKAICAWAATLKPKALAALNLLRYEPGITDTEVHRRVKAQYGSFNHERVPELRAELNKIVDRWRIIPSKELPVIDTGREKEIQFLPDAPTTDLESVDGGIRTALRYGQDSLGEAASRYDATSVGGVFNVIEADTADSANSRGGVAQSEIAGAWGAGKRHYDADQLATGRGGYGGDPTRLADQQRFASNFTEAELRRLREQADVADMNMRQLMIELSEYVAKAKEQAAVPELSQEQQLHDIDPALVPVFLRALRAQISIQTFRDVLQAADRAEVSRGSLDDLLTGLITFTDKRQAEEQKAQEDSKRAAASVRRKRRTKGVPVRVKHRKRMYGSG
jgi:hypothetical protein